MFLSCCKVTAAHSRTQPHRCTCTHTHTTNHTHTQPHTHTHIDTWKYFTQSLVLTKHTHGVCWHSDLFRFKTYPCISISSLPFSPLYTTTPPCTPVSNQTLVLSLVLLSFTVIALDTQTHTYAHTHQAFFSQRWLGPPPM